MHKSKRIETNLFYQRVRNKDETNTTYISLRLIRIPRLE